MSFNTIPEGVGRQEWRPLYPLVAVQANWSVGPTASLHYDIGLRTVRLRGVVTATAAVGAAVSPAFSLQQAHLRPSRLASFVVPATGGPVALTVAANGMVSVDSTAPYAAIGLNDTVALDVVWSC